jgi:hypothetical protein
MELERKEKGPLATKKEATEFSVASSKQFA